MGVSAGAALARRERMEVAKRASEATRPNILKDGERGGRKEGGRWRAEEREGGLYISGEGSLVRFNSFCNRTKMAGGGKASWSVTSHLGSKHVRSPKYGRLKGLASALVPHNVAWS